MSLLVDVTTFPQTFASGTWPTSSLNTGRFQITCQTGSASSNATTFPDGNFWSIVVANDNGGLWFLKSGGVMYIGYFNSSTGATIFQFAVSWNATTDWTVDVNHVTSTVTLSGFASGSGSFGFTPGGNGYSVAILGVGVYGGGGFTWTGTASDITDGVTGFTIAADPGAVGVAGTAAGVLWAHRVDSTAGAVALTGTAAGLLSGYRIAADPGAVALTGTNATLVFGSVSPQIQAEIGAVDVIGTAAALVAGRRVAADPGVVDVTGSEAALVHGYPLAADFAAVGIAGTDAGLVATRTIPAAAGAVPIAGTDAALAVGAALSIGDSGIDFQVFGNANRNALVTLNTQPTGSLVLVASGGKTSDVTQGVTDSNLNAWNRRAGNQGTQDYADFPGYGIVVETTRNPMTGGTAHTFSVPVTIFDENTTVAFEVIGGRRVAATSWRNVNNAAGALSLTSDPVTVDRASILIAIWGGSGPVFSPNTTPFQATPSSPWIAGPSYLVNNGNGEVQTATAYRSVGPGTYDVTWTQFPSQGAQMPVYAIQAAAAAPAEIGVVDITGTAATLARSQRIAADPGAVGIDTSDVAFVRGSSVAANPGDVAIAGAAAGLQVGHRLAADPGALTIAGTDAAVRAARAAAADVGAIAIAGAAAALVAARRLAADAGTAPIAGTDASLTLNGLDPDIPADSGAISITGGAAALLVGHQLAAQSGAVPVAGADAALVWSGAGAAFVLDAQPSSTPIGAPDVTFRRTWILSADFGAMPIGAPSTTLAWSGASAVSWSGSYATLAVADRLRSTLEPR